MLNKGKISYLRNNKKNTLKDKEVLFIPAGELLAITYGKSCDIFLTNEYFNYIFVIFCILIVVNGSNFFDGLNTLNVGYYLLISSTIFYLNFNQQIIFNENDATYSFNQTRK